MTRTIIMAIIMLMTSYNMVSAQQTEAQNNPTRQRLTREQLAEKQAKHMAQELQLSDAETEKFVKTFSECQKEIWALRPKQQQGNEPKTEQDNEARIKQRFAMSEKILDIRQKYYKEYSKFLTQAQIEKMYELERKDMKRMAGKAKDGRRQGRGPRPQQKND